jgi:hypothetical protein
MMIGLIVGAVFVGIAFALSMIFYDQGFRRFSYGYLTAFSFFLTISLGGLFLVTVMHLTRAGWGIAIRRIAEILGCMTFPMLFLFLPILFPVIFQSTALYEWNVKLEDSDLFVDKSKYFLNGGLFTLRCMAYFSLWYFLSRFFFTNSVAQDETGNAQLSLKMQRYSPVFMILLAVSLAFAAFDIQMSLDPHWFSTMYPVYFFATSVLSALASIILICLILQKNGRVTEDITIEHYHDLAKLMFGFIFFWGYIAFSQFMLIWYANMPEETFWFQKRFTDSGWIAWSILLLFGHLLIPFLGLMARTVRRNKKFLMFASCYMLVMHWVDQYWLIMPKFNEGSSLPFGLVDLCCWVGLGGFYVAGFCWIAGEKALIPVRDPRLPESLNFKNA